MVNRVQISNWAAVEALIAQARNRGRMLTNCYPDKERMSEWCAEGAVYAEESAGVTILWRDQQTFCNLFFFAESKDVLARYLTRDMDAICSRVVVDLIGLDALRLPLLAVFEAAGFGKISELVRMSRETPECTDVPVINNASADGRDIPDIQAIFREHFNPEVEQLPSDAELARWISKGGALVHRDDHDRVHSFIIYEMNKASLYLRYWFVNPQARNRGVGGCLMRTMFHHARFTRRQYFWVITDNENAVKRYEHYGFKAEPMRDVVLAKDFKKG